MNSLKLHQLFAQKNLQKPQNISGLSSGSLPYAVAETFSQKKQTLLLFVESIKAASQLKENLSFFLGAKDSIFIFPGMGVLPYYGLSPSSENIAQRMSVLYRLMGTKEPYICIVPMAALARRLPAQEILKSYQDYWVIGDEVDREDLLQRFVEAGYLNVPLVEDVGTFSKRGGIIDVFSPAMDTPLRLEFFGDQIEHIRSFDPETQRSQVDREDFVITAAREIVFARDNLKKASLRFRERANEVGLNKKHREPILEAFKNGLVPTALETYLPIFYDQLELFFDYLPQDYLGIWVEPELCLKHWEQNLQDIEHGYQSCQTAEKVISPDMLFLNHEELQQRLKLHAHWQLRELRSSSEAVYFNTHSHENLSAQMKHSRAGEEMLKPLLDQLKEWREHAYHILLVAGTHSQRLRIEDLLERQGLEFEKSLSSFKEFLERKKEFRPGLRLFEGELHQGFVWPEESLVVLTDQEIFGPRQRRRQSHAKAAEVFTSFEELQEGDYIVHRDHGLGVYRGLQHLNLDGHANDYLLLEYLGGDKLYLPVYRLDLISRYASTDAHVPQLDKLGGTSWEKNKTKVKESLKKIAGELLQLYAQRATASGHSFSPQGVLYEEFEAVFPFEETPDQLRAIKEVNQDMDASRPMDRLVCGDVGFGKTEVAMRAAFRAVLDHKQVAVLVPTTVLALQHERSFRQRFEKFPTNIAMLSRFSSVKRQKEIIEDLKAGKTDIVIGTHALLGQKVQFKDFGLLIIDEEHRFGVAQKEKIKKLKTQADVLALTATPIPRTLNMSLSGIRDLSVITTPPIDRLAIQTLVADFNESLIREAVMRELARGGQIYFVHNRVQSIQLMKEKLQKIVPEAKIGVGHGQMSEKELEEVMLGFLNKEFNLFLCTSIVESGLDIPTANTMIINRADHFGLAQLYQLRGRIGRSNIRAYAYLLTPGTEQITPRARARLAVLQRYTDLGSGFKIAAHDLEIRGSGHLLGAEQSGHIEAMGYDLYNELLEEAILEAKQENQTKAPEPELKLGLAAAIPESYLPETTMRLTLYKRLSSVHDEEELESLIAETADRFGEIPQEMEELLILIRFRILAKRVWLTAVQIKERYVSFSFDPQSPIDIDALSASIQKEPERFRWTQPHELVMNFKAGKEKVALESALKFLMGLKTRN